MSLSALTVLRCSLYVCVCVFARIYIYIYIYTHVWLPSGSAIKNPPVVQEIQVQSLNWEYTLDKGSIPAGKSQSMGLQTSWTRLSD